MQYSKICFHIQNFTFYSVFHSAFCNTPKVKLKFIVDMTSVHDVEQWQKMF